MPAFRAISIKITTQSMQKGLKRHLLSCIPPPPEPTTKIESIRFRSVAFKAPTNPLALRDGEAKPKSKPRNLERASAWKSVQKGEGLFAEGTKPKEHLTPAEKKRIAFIKGEFHEQGDSVNAFVVFAHQDSTKQVRDTWMDPSDAAAFVVEKMNRSRFEGRTLRVDRVGQSAKIATKDTTKTIFVGNLDFAAKEEQLRIFFETLLTSEIGPATGDGGDDSQSSEPEDGHGSAAQRPRWVHDVRIIRDEGTQLGKGFAYVRFSVGFPWLFMTCINCLLRRSVPASMKSWLWNQRN
jgi:nucleolar protein 12